MMHYAQTTTLAPRTQHIRRIHTVNDMQARLLDEAERITTMDLDTAEQRAQAERAARTIRKAVRELAGLTPHAAIR